MYSVKPIVIFSSVSYVTQEIWIVKVNDAELLEALRCDVGCKWKTCWKDIAPMNEDA